MCRFMAAGGWPLVLLTILSLGTPSKAQAIDITATGDWTSLVIGAANLIGGAGTDLQSTYESAADQTSITVSNCTSPDDAWRVDVRRTDGTWDTGVTLSVRRTGDGTGTGSISGGSTYQAVGTIDVTFFTGSGDRTALPISYQLSGVSVQVPPNLYSTTVTFTVVDT